MASFGEKIKAAREKLDYSQTQVAEMIPMNQSNYSKIERDIQEPDLFQLKRLVEILNLDPYNLLELSPKLKRQQQDRRFLNGIIALYNKLYE